ncbi:questin oxidase family protein [Aspergillus undulatus]|uniref:questin oxidase family protein n=1 Tax=Aspergillus undulatus TaxID=1810928 RepID=UPI003CCCA0A8
MATARKIQLSPQTDTGVWSTGVTEDSAKAANEVLQEDLEKHHVYFNNMGFHNHIAHHILTIYALGASPSEIKAAYDRNKTYQRRRMPVHESVVQDLHDNEKFRSSLGKEKNYENFLEFFQREIEQKGTESVLNGYLFSGDENAESMMARLVGGLLHPIIHLGFGIEFNQPAIIAEALAQTAIHDDWTGPMFLFPVEKAAGGVGKRGSKTMLQLLEEARTDRKLASSVHWEDGNKLRDGVLKRAPEEMIKYASQWTVSEEQMQEKFAEMVDTSVYFTSASQRPSKKVKFDFFYIHAVNSSIFYSKILALPFLDTRTRIRLLEWKGRMDLLMYISRNAPELYLDRITKYPVSSDWDTIVSQSRHHPQDDGHLSKLVRALRNAESVCDVYKGQEKERGLKIAGDSWLRIGNMVNDSVQSSNNEEALWIRSTGFDEAWADVDQL